MKKLGILILLCLALTALGGCAQDSGEKESVPRELQLLRDRELPALSREASLDMLNYMLVNRALVAEGKLYCLDYDESYAPVLARYRLTGGLRREAVLAEDCVPEFLSLVAGRLYYRNARHEGAIESVDLNGGDFACLRQEGCQWLRADESGLYFCDSQGRYCTAALDGSGETVLLSEPCDSPWPLEGALLYRRQADGQLRLRWLQEGDDIPMSQGEGSRPLILDGQLYYSSGESLHSVSLSGLDGRRYRLPPLLSPAELLPQGEELLLRGLAEDQGVRQWTARLQSLEETLQYSGERGYRLCDYIGPEGRVDAVYNPDGRLRCFVWVSAAGDEQIYMAGSTA